MGANSRGIRGDAGQVGVKGAAVVAVVAVVALCFGLVVAVGSTAVPAADQPSGPVNDQGWTAPTEGRISSLFRPPSRPDHAGTDIANREGTPIWAAAGGKVVQAECTSSTCARREVGNGCGWTVRLDHGGDVATRYCHMRDRPKVSTGDTVRAGQVIGYMGSTGDSTGDHLHFECYTAGAAVDCQPFMKARGVTL